MKWILISVWLATTQSYNRPDVRWHEVATQEFNTQDACLFAARTIYKSAPDIRMTCVPKGKEKSNG